MPLSPVPRSLRAKLSASLAGVVLALCGAEAALRAAGFDHPRGPDRRIVWSAERDRALRRGDGLYRFDPVCLWSPRPGALIPWTTSERINPDGFRGPQLPLEPRPGVLRIAALGGATTLGVGVRWEDTYCAMLVHLLTERGVPAEVLCAGAEDHTSVQGLERWREQVRVWRPQVLICTLTGSMGLSQAVQGRKDIERIADLRGNPRTERAGSLRDDLRLLHLTSWLRDLASGVYWRERDAEFFDRRLAATVGELDWPGQRRVPYDEYVVALAEQIREAKAEGASVILISIPRSPTLPLLPVLDAYQKGTALVAEREGATFIDGRVVLKRAVAEEDIPPQDLFLDDLGLSECGHLAIAQALAEEILARGARGR
jgi:hypothetical protein